MIDCHEMESFCKSLTQFLSLDDEMRDCALEMVKIISDPNVDSDDKLLAAHTLDDILYPPTGINEARAKLEAIPYEHRLFWCESAACACMGCANRCGVTKSEWRRYGKSLGLKLSAWGNRFEGTPPPGTSVDAIDTFSLRLMPTDPTQRYEVIKVIRRNTGLDLRTARDLVAAAPKVFMERVSKERAIEIQKEIEAAGGKATMALDNG